MYGYLLVLIYYDLILLQINNSIIIIIIIIYCECKYKHIYIYIDIYCLYGSVGKCRHTSSRTLIQASSIPIK